MTGSPAAIASRAPGQVLIGGEWRDADSHAELTVEDPASGTPIASVPDCRAAEALDALEAAVAEQPLWGRSSPMLRAKILSSVADTLVAKRDSLAELITAEMGKSVAESRAEIDYSAGYFRWYAGEAVRIDGRLASSPDREYQVVVSHQPVGPCLLVTPWNFPMAMGARKVAAAIAAGCTMILKPASLTPLSSLMLAKLCAECGLPPGVLNVITSSEPTSVVDPLMADGRLRKVSFTGSTEVGRKLLAAAAPQIVRSSMELGGNAPFVVFDDADLDKAVDGALLAKLRNVGQSCVAANRFLVSRAVEPEFTERFTKRMSETTLGPGLGAESELGPLVDRRQRASVEGMVDAAVRSGANLRTGGQALDGPGAFYPPTVLTDIAPDSQALTEEIFGPVAPIVAFDGEEEAFELANNTVYGLVSYVFTESLSRAHRAIDQLDAGMVGVNRGLVSNPAAPFGGTKLSGLGREGGREGILDYLDVKYAALQT